MVRRVAYPLLLLSAFILHFEYSSSPAEAAPASIQDGGAAASGNDERTKSRARRKRVKEKYRAMLERNPYHDLALTKVLQFAAEENTIDALVEEFQSLVRENASEPGYRFILARLYQRGDRLVEAVAELEQIAETNGHLLGLLGEIYTQQGEFLRAAETLENAAEQAKDEKSLRKLYRAIGDLHLAQGKKGEAAAAYRRIIEIDPESFYLRQGVAETLAEGGLLEEALGDWRALLDLARDDSSKRCAVLREMGRIHERRKDFDEALDHYTRAAQLLRRGNWMKADIESRIVRVHRERGTLDSLEEEVRKRIEANPQDIDPHIFLAMVLEEKGEVDRAAEAIGAATRIFPDDLDLGKRRIALLRDIGDSETQIQEYQRLIARHPEEVDLYIELGRIFAREEKFSQAKLQWESLLAEEVRDPNLCLRLADLYARFDLVEDAIRSHELAIQIAPKEKSHRVALGSYLYSLGRKDEALARWSEIKTLGQAAEMTLAEILLGHAFEEEALEIADAIREKGVREARLYLLLSEIHRALDDPAAAYEAAREAADLAKTDSLRDEAITTVVSLHESAEATDILIEAEESRKGTDDPVPYLILGEAFTRTRQTARAIDVYRELLERIPEEIGVVERLADLYLSGGDLDASVESFERVLSLRPGKERPIFKKIAEIHLKREDREKAFETWKRMIRSQPDNPVVYKDVAKEYKRLGLPDDAIEHYRQALQRSPSDPVEIRLDLAGVLASKQDDKAALEELHIALSEAKKDEDRRDVRKRIFELYRSRGTLEQEILGLEKTVEENPYDVEAALLLTDFFLRAYEFPRAIEMLDRVIPFQRGDPSLLMQKARLLIEMEEQEQAIEVYEMTLNLKGSHRDVAYEEIGKAHSKMGNRDKAAEAWASLSDRLAEAELLRENQMAEEALARYDTLLAKAPTDPTLWIEKARVLRKMGKRERSADAYQRVLEVKPTHRKALNELGALWMDLKQKEKAVDVGRRLLGSKEEKKKKKRGDKDELIYDSSWGYWYYSGSNTKKRSNFRLARDYFQKHGLLAEFAEILEEEIAQTPMNLEALLSLAMIYERELSQPAKALEIYRGMLEKEWDKDVFTQIWQAIQTWWYPQTYVRPKEPEEEIWQLIQNIHGRRADIRQERLEALQAKEDRTREETLELAALYVQSGMQEESGETLRKGAESLPDSSRFVALLARRAASDDQDEEAVGHYRTLIERVREDPNEMTEKEEKKLRTNTRNSIPFYIRDNATKAQIDAVIDLVVTDQKRERRMNRWVPSERDILAALARSAFKMGGDGQSKQALDEILEQGDDFLNLTFVGDIYFQNEKYDEAEELYLRAQADSKARMKNPVHEWHYRHNASGISRRSIRNLGLIYKKRKEFMRAYDSLREGGYTNDAKVAYKEGKLAEVAQERYRSQMEESLPAMGGEDEEQREEARKAYLEATVKLAEILEEEDQVEDSIAVYREALEHCTPDLAVALWTAIATLHEKERELDEAIEAQRQMISLKKEMNSDIARYRERKGLPLVPTHAGPTGSSFQYSRRSYGRAARTGFSTRFDTRENYFAMADLFTKKGEPKAGVRALMRYYRENPGQSHYSWEIQRFAQANDLQAEILPLFRLFGMEKAKYPWQKMDYARALEKGEEWEDAIEQYESILTDFPSTNNDYYFRESERRLKVLYQRTGKSEKILTDLAAAVEENPRNIKKRLKLARLYNSQEMFEEAAKHLVLLRQEAPYLPEVHQLGRKVHIARGDRKGAIADLRKEIELRTGAGERTALYYVLGNLLDMEADGEASRESWMDMVSPQDANSYMSLGNFLLELQRDDLAAEIYRKGLEAGAKYHWRGFEIVTQAARLAFYRDQIPEAMKLLDQLREMQPGFVYGLFSSGNRGANILRVSLEGDKFIGILRTLAEVKGDDADVWLLLAATLKAHRKIPEMMEVLNRALEARPHEQRILKMLMDEYQGMGRMEEAIAWGERWLSTLPADTQSFTASSPMSFSPYMYQAPPTGKKGGYSTLAHLYRRAGDLEKAKEYILKLEDKTKPHTYMQLADAFDRARFHEEAVEAMRTFIEKAPDRSSQHLIRLSHMLKQIGESSEALVVLGEALEIATGDRQEHQVYQAMETIYKEEKNLDVLLYQLKAKLVEDPKALPTLLFLAKAYRSRGELDQAKSYLQKAAEEHPSSKEPLQAVSEIYQEDRDWAKAIETVEHIIEIFPNEKKSRSSELARLYMKIGEKDKAVEYWKAGQRDLQSYSSQQTLGRTFASNKLYDEAVEAYREAIRLAPTGRSMDSIRTSLASALLESGDLKGALQTYLEAFGGKTTPASLISSEAILRYLLADDTAGELLDEARSAAAADRTANQVLLLGLERLFADDLKEASRIFRIRVEEAPYDKAAWGGLYLSARRSGDLDSALKACFGWKETEERDEGKVSSLLWKIGDLQQRLGQSEEAVASWRRAGRTAKYPLYEYQNRYYSSSPSGRSTLIDRLTRYELDDRAMGEIERDVALGRLSHRGALTKAAEILRRSGDETKAFEYEMEASFINGSLTTRLRRTVKDPGRQEAILDPIKEQLELQPANQRLRKLLASIYDQIEQPQLAIDLYREAYEKDKDNQSLQQQVATRLAKEGQYEEALPMLEELWKKGIRSLRSSSSMISYFVGGSTVVTQSYNQGRWRSSRKAPGNLLLLVYEALGKDEEAADLEEDILRGYRGRTHAYFIEAARLLAGHELYEEALRWIERADRVAPDELDDEKALERQQTSIRTLKMRYLKKLDRLAEAEPIAREQIASLEEQLSKKPWNVNTYSSIANLHANFTKDWDAAVSAATTNAEGLPFSSTGWSSLGWIQLRKGDAEAAATAFEKSQSLLDLFGSKDDGALLLGRALSAHHRGKADEASRLLERAEELIGPDLHKRQDEEFKEDIDAIRAYAK